MLRFYDKVRIGFKSTSLLALAAAGGLVFSPAATADVACTAQDGYAQELSEYVAEATSCLSSSSALRVEMQDEIAAHTNTARESLGLTPLSRRTSLDQAAQAHALDMANRQYAAHDDQEGRDHLYRIRAFDRTLLVGETGANVLVSAGSESSKAMFASMGQDIQNAKNVVHEGFSDFGVGIAEQDGQLFTVVLFATKEGELNEALPLHLQGYSPLRADLERTETKAVGWTLSDHLTGAIVGKGSVPKIGTSRLQQVDSASVEILVSESTDTYVLKGPLVSAR